MQRRALLALVPGAAVVLAGCAMSSGGSHNSDDHGHPASMPMPSNIPTATSPKYPVGSEVKVTADHMPGMQGVTAKVTGVFQTTTYAIDYTPTDGTDPVTDHKWVVHEELQAPGQAPLADGTEVTVTAEHMAGMSGAKGTVRSSTDQPVYTITYSPSDGGEEVVNHRWVTEDELTPA